MSEYPVISRLRSFLLWSLAVLIMLCAVIYQRATGPTYPLKGTLTNGDQSARYKLIRSDWSDKTNDAARVALPFVGDSISGTLHYKRLRTSDAFTQLPLVKETDKDGKSELAGYLPAQPSAGKLEYFLTVQTNSGEVRIPQANAPNVIIRFKDVVPGFILWPHVVMMFFSVLIGMRAGLGAIWAPRTMRKWAWTAFIGMSVGGMVFGPIVQKYAFGEFWTGFPWGGDWTDNKMLIMWLAWLVAVGVAGLKTKITRDFISRWAIVLGSIVMTGAYLIPHSMGGSELDYSKVDQGIDPAKAISTGKK